MQVTRAEAVVGRFGPTIALTVALAVFSWRVRSPSPWWDEAVTRYAVGLSLPDLADMISRVDLVHALYYLAGHILYLLLGRPDDSNQIYLALRLLSVLASSFTALILFRLGRNLGGPAVAVLAVAFYVISPFALRYAQEARSYALVSMFATLAVLLLVRWTRTGEARLLRLSSASLALATLLNEISALTVLPLAVVCLLARPSGFRRWLLSGGVALAVASPLVLFSLGQSGQVSWLYSPTPTMYADFSRYLWGSATAAGLVTVIAAGLVWRGRTRVAASGPQLTMLVGLSMSLLPSAVLWVVSQVEPVFVPRYLVFVLPGACLVAAGLAACLPRAGAVIMVAALFLTGFSLQDAYRQPVTGHGEDIRGAAEALGAQARAGDAVVFLPRDRRVVSMGYPERFDGVADVALAGRYDSIYGSEVGPDVLTQRLAGRSRVWVVSGKQRLGDTLTATDEKKQEILGRGYAPVSVFNTRTYSAVLYVSDEEIAAQGLTALGDEKLDQCPYCP
ncbi:glycosyltransferase family 39 protein [Kineosporia succinea]|uniref:Mannosyltransferase n=1 Tax=Kineosporia succinea TaxID=84632 RepID=A0ABT9P1G8_9ACTN|nr:glycosyltransferase family 39 protein [Kineosporia succinea]MDP9825935.1 mannosyltransferase [Kineosporia succinea]